MASLFFFLKTVRFDSCDITFAAARIIHNLFQTWVAQQLLFLPIIICTGLQGTVQNIKVRNNVCAVETTPFPSRLVLQLVIYFQPPPYSSWTVFCMLKFNILEENKGKAKRISYSLKIEEKKVMICSLTWSKWEPSSLMQVSRGLLHNGADPQASPNPAQNNWKICSEQLYNPLCLFVEIECLVR